MEIIFLIIFALVVVASPWISTEDRPDFLHPESKGRQAVGGWFAPRTR